MEAGKPEPTGMKLIITTQAQPEWPYATVPPLEHRSFPVFKGLNSQFMFTAKGSDRILAVCVVEDHVTEPPVMPTVPEIPDASGT